MKPPPFSFAFCTSTTHFIQLEYLLKAAFRAVDYSTRLNTHCCQLEQLSVLCSNPMHQVERQVGLHNHACIYLHSMSCSVNIFTFCAIAQAFLLCRQAEV